MSIKAIVRTYIEQIRPKANIELDWFRQQPTFKAVVEIAALAINRDGKRFLHQRRLKKAALEQARDHLFANLQILENSRNFDDLFTLIEKILDPISGIGELYIYDTALRIGVKKNLLPAKVYLHAGTRKGAQALGLNSKTKALDLSAFSEDFRQLAPHEVEDVLCIFKDKLKGNLAGRLG